MPPARPGAQALVIIGLSLASAPFVATGEATGERGHRRESDLAPASFSSKSAVAEEKRLRFACPGCIFSPVGVRTVQTPWISHPGGLSSSWRVRMEPMMDRQKEPLRT